MSLKKNFIYSSILTCANYIFPLITYPYVSRVLGVTNIGICNFVDSIINYFILFSMMGVGAVGIREIAGSMNEPQRQSRVFSSLLALNGITTVIMLVVLFVSIYIIPELYEYRKLMYIGAAKLVANLFLVEWYFKGTENFKYITNRTILVKCIYVAAVFLFVKDSSDYSIYFLLLSLMVIVNAGINFLYACTKVKLTTKGLMIRPFIKPFIIMGVYMLLTSMYTSFNVAYLGFACSPEQVGYYTTATKIFSIILSLYTAFTGVMLPRMSALYAEGNLSEFKRLIDKSLDLLLSMSVPAVLFTMLYAPEIILLISGKGYEGAYIPARIIMPLILIIGYEQILVLQVLLPAKKDKAVLRNSILGAIVGVLLNVIIVKNMQSIGSAITWLLSEVVVLIAASCEVKRLIGLKFPIKQFVYRVISYLPIVVVLFCVRSFLTCSSFQLLLFSILLMCLYTFCVLYFCEKNPIIYSFVHKLINRLKQK